MADHLGLQLRQFFFFFSHLICQKLTVTQHTEVLGWRIGVNKAPDTWMNPVSFVDFNFLISLSLPLKCPL